MIHAISHVCVESHRSQAHGVSVKLMWSWIWSGNVSSDWEWNPEGRRKHRFSGHFKFLEFGLLEPLGFSSSVLKPDLHLSLRQVEWAGELGPFGDGQVLFLPELPLQRQQLRRAERGPGLSVGLVFPQRTRGRTETPWSQPNKHTDFRLIIQYWFWGLHNGSCDIVSLKEIFYFKYLILKNNGYKRCFKITIFEPSSDGRRTFS